MVLLGRSQVWQGEREHSGNRQHAAHSGSLLSICENLSAAD
jgi:hypothetical protein